MNTVWVLYTALHLSGPLGVTSHGYVSIPIETYQEAELCEAEALRANTKEANAVSKYWCKIGTEADLAFLREFQTQ